MALSHIAYIFPFMMVLAGIGDLLTMRIPNMLNLAIAGLFFVAALVLGMPISVILWHLLAGFLTLAVGIGLFLSGKFGGGDAKMLAAGALWVGWQGLLPFIIWTALIGGLLSLIWLICRPIKLELELRGFAVLNKLLPAAAQLPYGVAIAAGSVLSFSSTWWFERLSAAGV